MDDLRLEADKDIDQKVKEVDEGLKKGNFIVDRRPCGDKMFVLYIPC